MQRVDRLYVSDKDDEYYYRWVNAKDMNVLEASLNGFETVHGADPLMPTLTAPVVPLTGQNTDVPVGGATRQRGDLVLMRIRKDRYEETIGAEERERRERQETTLDTMILQSNENARNALKQRGMKNIPRELVFREQ